MLLPADSDISRPSTTGDVLAAVCIFVIVGAAMNGSPRRARATSLNAPIDRTTKRQGIMRFTYRASRDFPITDAERVLVAESLDRFATAQPDMPRIPGKSSGKTIFSGRVDIDFDGPLRPEQVVIAVRAALDDVREDLGGAGWQLALDGQTIGWDQPVVRLVDAQTAESTNEMASFSQRGRVGKAVTIGLMLIGGGPVAAFVGIFLFAFIASGSLHPYSEWAWALYVGMVLTGAGVLALGAGVIVFIGGVLVGTIGAVHAHGSRPRDTER